MSTLSHRAPPASSVGGLPASSSPTGVSNGSSNAHHAAGASTGPGTEACCAGTASASSSSSKAAPTGAGGDASAAQSTTTNSAAASDSLVHALAGGLGSALALALTYPLDQVRTFQQVHDSEEDDAFINGEGSPLLTAETCADSAWARTIAPLLRPWRSATVLVARHGPGALYRGIVPVLISMGVSNWVFFFVNHFLKAVLTRYRQKTGRSLGYFGHLATSTIAGVINVLVTTPLWVASMRAKLESGQGWDIFAIMLRVYREEGLQALWSGTLPSLLLVINPVLQHFCYDQLKRVTLTHRRATATATAGAAAAVALTGLEAFSFGAVAKSIATVVSYPLQVAQSRLRQQQQRQQQQQQHEDKTEVQGEETDRIGGRANYSGTADCLADLWRRKGLAGLFQGIEAKLLQTVLTSAFMFLAYENIYRATKKALEAGAARPKLLLA